MDQNQNLEANQIGTDSSKKEDSAKTTSLYNNNQPQQPLKSPRPPPSSPATKKFASVARSFIRAVFCSPVKNEQKSIRKLSNPEAAAEAADDAVAMPPAAAHRRRHYQRNHGYMMEQVETCSIDLVSNRHRQRCVSEVYKPKLTLSRNQMNETCSQGILFYVWVPTMYIYLCMYRLITRKQTFLALVVRKEPFYDKRPDMIKGQICSETRETLMHKSFEILYWDMHY